MQGPAVRVIGVQRNVQSRQSYRMETLLLLTEVRVLKYRINVSSLLKCSCAPLLPLVAPALALRPPLLDDVGDGDLRRVLPLSAKRGDEHEQAANDGADVWAKAGRGNIFWKYVYLLLI